MNNILECELYSTAYLDTLDSIAYLLRKNIIPQGIAEYFENYFAYGLRMIIWLGKANLGEPIKTAKKQNKKSVPEDVSFERWYENKDPDIEVVREYPWPDLLNWCKEGGIEPYDDDQLPQIMQDAIKKEKK